MVVIEEGQQSSGAYAPDLPGCIAAGESREEVLRLIREAIELHLEAIAEVGELPPIPHFTSELVEVRIG